MPYKLRKAPSRNLYWVIALSGKRMSIDPIPFERAKKQMIALNIAHAKKMGYI